MSYTLLKSSEDTLSDCNMLLSSQTVDIQLAMTFVRILQNVLISEIPRNLMGDVNAPSSEREDLLLRSTC